MAEQGQTQPQQEKLFRLALTSSVQIGDDFNCIYPIDNSTVLLGMDDNILHYNLDTDQHQKILKRELVVKDMFKDYRDRLVVSDQYGALKMFEMGDFKNQLPYQYYNDSVIMSMTQERDKLFMVNPKNRSNLVEVTLADDGAKELKISDSGLLGISVDDTGVIYGITFDGCVCMMTFKDDKMMLKSFKIKDDCKFSSIVTKGGYICVTGYKNAGNSTINKIFVFDSEVELVAKTEIEVEGEAGYCFTITNMDIAIAGRPVIIIASEGYHRNLYAFAFENNRIYLVDKIDDLHEKTIIDVKYFNGHYFTYGKDGVINRVSLSK